MASPRTLVAITVAFASGIAMAGSPYGVAPAWWHLAAVGVAWVTALAARADRLGATLAILTFMVLGAFHAAAFDRRDVRWPEGADGRTVTARATVQAPPEAIPGGWRAVIRLHRMSIGEPMPRGRRGRAQERADAEVLDSEDVLNRQAQPVDAMVRVTGRPPLPLLHVGDEVALRGRFRAGRPAGNPGERSERQALRRRGLVGVIAVSPAAGIRIVRVGKMSPRGIVAGIRARAVEALLQALPAPHDGLALSLLLGIDTHLPPEIYRQFSQAGLIHLMVVSGTQVAIVAGTLTAAARLARLPAWVAAGAVALGVSAFAATVGWAPSISRAVLMTFIALAATLLGRERDRGATLAAAALVLLALSPSLLVDIGFQLSFAASWGLLFVAPALHRLLAGLGSRLSAAFAVTLGAQVAVAPLLVAHFQTIPLGGIIANVLALPIVAVLVPLGFALIPIAVVVPALGLPLLGLIQPGLTALMWIGTRFGEIAWATVPTPPAPPAIVALSYAALAAAVAIAAGPWRPSRAQCAWATALVIACVTLWCAASTRPPSLLTVTALDVGQGDAILIRSPSGRTVLIDGGGEVGAERSGWDVGRMRVVPALRRAGVRRLDVVLLSHPHEDHVGGLPAVVENFPVGIVLDPGVPHPSPSYARFLRLVEARRIPYRQAKAGLHIDLGSGVGLTILHPPDPAPPLDGDPVHARGVVARLTYGSTALLFTGDVEAPVEQYLLDRGISLASQVLKVGHHGSRTSTSPEFVARVAPRIAVISLGADNAFGHPHRMTLDTLTAAGTTIYRTDRDGAVTITSDGTEVRATPFRGAAGAGVR